jgi:hypothetical protein
MLKSKLAIILILILLVIGVMGLRLNPDGKTDALAQPKIVAGPVMPPIGPPPGGG